MPLEQRVVDPICISRGTLPLDASGNLAISIPNELECVTNGSLANVIRQLSSLSSHAEELFGGILEETSVLISRASSLQVRIDRLAVKVTQLDSSVEEISLQDIHLKKPFKSSSCYDQQVVSRQTMPSSLVEQYNTCDKPPPLSKLNPYRDDNRDGLKFYTDPTYFFELWRQEMLQMTERESRIRHTKNANRHKGSNGILKNGTNRSKTPRQPRSTVEKYQHLAAQQEFLPLNSSQGAQNSSMYIQDVNGYPAHNHNSSGAYGTLQRPNSLEINQYIEHQQPPQTAYGQTAYGYNTGGAGSSHGAGVNPINHNGHHGMNQMNHVNPKTGSPGVNNMMSGQHMASGQIQQQQMPSPYGQNSQDPNHSYGQQQSCSSQSQSAGGTPTRNKGGISSRPSQPPPAPPSNPSSNSSSGQATPTAGGTPSRGSRGASLTRDVLPPPPPPPPPSSSYDNPVMNGDVMIAHNHMSNSDLLLPAPHPHSTSAQAIHSSSANRNNSSQLHSNIPSSGGSSGAPPPPPPPPLPMDNSTPHDMMDSSSNTQQHNGNNINPNPPRLNMGPTFAQQIQAKQQQLQPPKMNTMSKVLPPHVAQQDARSGLLAAIRQGITLRRVEDIKQKEVEKSAPCNDVAAILARRLRMEFSDSESGGDHSDASDSDEWNEAEAAAGHD